METQTTKNLPTTVGKKGRVKMPPDGEVFTFTVVDELSRMQENSQNSKLLLLQKLKFDNDGHSELRFCYYIVGKKEGMKGRWVYGQFSPIAPPRDILALLEEAKNKDWFS
jgi:hypothetical protein